MAPRTAASVLRSLVLFCLFFRSPSLVMFLSLSSFVVLVLAGCLFCVSTLRATKTGVIYSKP